MPERNIHVFVKKFTPIYYCGKPIIAEMDVVDTYEVPFETSSTVGEHDFNVCPNCQKDLKLIKEYLTQKYKGNDSRKAFPNCCEGHSQVINLKEYKISDFENVPSMVADKIIYTYSHIRNYCNSDTYYKDITDYIDYTMGSFGCMPGNAEPLFQSDYIRLTKLVVKNSKSISENIKKLVNEYFDSLTNSKSSSSTDFNILIQTYERWLKVFPFELNSYFGDLKEYFEKRIPLFNGLPEFNVYSNVSKVKAHTKASLIEFLMQRTNNLLTKINGVSLFEKGLITDSSQLKLELVINERKLKLREGYRNNSKDEEAQYRKIIKTWLKDEKRFIDEITPLITDLPPKEIETKTHRLKETLANYGFYELESVKVLSDSSKQNLIELICNNDLPYVIAMIDYLGLLKHLMLEHFNAKCRLNREVSKWFNADKTGRSVKGNISTLSSKSNEDRKKYTAHLYKETVIRDYQNIK